MLLISCLWANKGLAQSTDYVDTKEKVYLQTNHVFFRQGESVFFKIYLVNAKDQTPSRESASVKVDIIGPAGTLIREMKYPVYDGYAEGAYTFEEGAPGGIYKIKAYTTWMQNEEDRTLFVKEITLQKVIAPRVLMRLDFPRKGYGPGDEVTADYEMRNLADQPIRDYEANYTIQISGTTIASGSFKTNPEGKYRLRFRLPNDLSSNDGLLNITVNYNAYTEAISRSIPITLNKIDLQFMPEGGTQVNGIANNIAFRSLDEHGKPVDIKGEIRDENGSKVVAFESYKFGMGQFTLNPLAGHSYSAVITSPAINSGRFRLPVAANDGVVLNVFRENGRTRIRIVSTSDQQLRLSGQTKNVYYYNNTIAIKQGEQTIDIDEGIFPAGIARFTVLTPSGLPLAERLSFLNSNRIVHASITTDKTRYQPREKVTMTLKTLDDKGKPVPSNFSLSVVDDKLWTLADDKQDHIVSWLLMSSELQGKIEEPAFYFKKNEEKASGALDLVMLTHGYRYFDFIPYVRDEHKLLFLPNQHNVLSGVVLDLWHKPVKADVYLLEANRSNGRAIHMQTTDSGGFFFSGIMPDVDYLLTARSLKKHQYVFIRILESGSPYNALSGKQVGMAGGIAPDMPALKMPAQTPQEIGAEQKPEKSLAGNLNGLIALGEGEKRLEEVIVVGYNTTPRKLLTGSVAVVGQSELAFGSNSMSSLLNGRMAGIAITEEANPGAASAVMIRGNRSLTAVNGPLYVVDGIPVAKTELNLHPGNITSITVLKDAAATAIYGSRGAEGVILITTKQKDYRQLRINITRDSYYATTPIMARATVYTVAKKFYIPRYHTTTTSIRDDFRETIYWNPVVQTDNNGEANVEFYNSDATTTFRAIAEGIGYNGTVGRAETTYVAQNKISVDAKIPPYLTVGDKTLIPLVIRNNSLEKQSLPIHVILPPGLKAGDYPEEVTLLPDSAQQVLIPVEVTAAVKDIGRIITGAIPNAEMLSLPLQTADKGFPLNAAFSGNRSAQHDFNISKAIPGTLKVNLKLYKDITGRFTDDIAAMLRAPYGCFEQTSSTTYPNIFILKYLKQTGTSNPAVEKKALDYIEAGYKRLISFETSEHGFEWFGHTPAHEPLTAYGLLEFTDMQEFIKVDQAMLQRTKEFLLKRRDGKGGFRISPGAYHFHAIPENVANVYIVYAMTQAGYGNDIQSEYKKAVEKALVSKDGYELSLAALSASNMKDEENFAKLMKHLADWYRKNDFKSAASIMASGGASLKVELLSLYALSLMREKPCNTALVAEVISGILSARSYYGYGATQSTVLALNALIEYSKLMAAIAARSELKFTVDGAQVAAGDNIAAMLQEGKHTFAVQYEDGKEAIPYTFEVSYSTYTPPNSAEAVMKLATHLSASKTRVGETLRMEVAVSNTKPEGQGMTIAMIGIPAGLSAQPWQLKELTEKNQVAYYEIFDNYLVLYWKGFEADEHKKINLDLKAEIPGTYKGKAANTYLYYTPEYKHWNEGLEVEILP